MGTVLYSLQTSRSRITGSRSRNGKRRRWNRFNDRISTHTANASTRTFATHRTQQTNTIKTPDSWHARTQHTTTRPFDVCGRCRTCVSRHVVRVVDFFCGVSVLIYVERKRSPPAVLIGVLSISCAPHSLVVCSLRAVFERSLALSLFVRRIFAEGWCVWASLACTKENEETALWLCWCAGGGRRSSVRAIHICI